MLRPRNDLNGNCQAAVWKNREECLWQPRKVPRHVAVGVYKRTHSLRRLGSPWGWSAGGRTNEGSLLTGGLGWLVHSRVAVCLTHRGQESAGPAPCPRGFPRAVASPCFLPSACFRCVMRLCRPGVLCLEDTSVAIRTQPSQQGPCGPGTLPAAL